jgi:diguanylate cyclase
MSNNLADQVTRRAEIAPAAPQRYGQSLEQSQEVFRLALAAMTRSSARPTPVAYAVWFEHLSGTNAELSAGMEALNKRGTPVTDDDMVDLYQRFIMDLDALMTRKLGDDLGRVLGDIQSSVQESKANTATYQASLERFQHGLQVAGVQEAPEVGVKTILLETGSFTATVSALDGVLASSQGEIEKLKVELQRVREEVFSDALTGLSNRRGFDTSVLALSENARKTGQTLALIMLDIDHFKRVNDAFGHLVGDRVIKGVGAAIASAVKKGDIAARYGGEEFAVLLPGASAKVAQQVAERVRDTVSRATIKRLDKKESVGNVTISGGIAIMRDNESLLDFINRADKALYAAKQGGRNRVMAA